MLEGSASTKCRPTQDTELTHRDQGQGQENNYPMSLAMPILRR